MPSTRVRVWAAAVVAVAAGVVLLVAAFALVRPASWTRSYYAVEQQWARHWPFDRGKGLPARLHGAIPTRLQLLIRPTAPMWVQVEPSVTMLLDPDDLVSHEILRTGTWEPENWAAIERHLGRDAVFVDVGAHIGYYSLKAAKIVGPSGRVIAVEPNPATVRELRDNIGASGATVIDVQPIALSDTESSVDLYAAPRANTGQSSLSKANASQGGQISGVYKVRARPLDAVVNETGVSRVDAIKIDVEGAELLVLKGSAATLERYHPVLLVELIDAQLRAMGTSEAETRAFLQAHGYEGRPISRDTYEFVPTATAPSRGPTGEREARPSGAGAAAPRR